MHRKALLGVGDRKSCSGDNLPYCVLKRNITIAANNAKSNAK